MVEALGYSLATFSNGFTGFTKGIIYLLTLAIVIGLVWLIFYYLSFNKRVIVRRVINGRTVIIYDKARQFKTKEGVVKWRLWKSKFVVGLPPDDCIDISTKGAYVAECFLSPDGNLKWLAFDNNSQNVSPFTSEERTLLVHEYRESENYKKKKLGEMIMTLAPFLAIVIILVVFMIFFSEVVAPTVGLANSLTSATIDMKESMLRMEAVCLNRPQLLSNNLTGNFTRLPPN